MLLKCCPACWASDPGRCLNTVIPGLTATEEAAMGNPTDAKIAELQADWPRWEFWIVPRAVGGPVWCARRRDHHKRVVNAASAEHLAEHLEDAADAE